MPSLSSRARWRHAHARDVVGDGTCASRLRVSEPHPWMGGAWDCEGGDDFAARAADPALVPRRGLDFVGANVGNAWRSDRDPDAGAAAPVRRPASRARASCGSTRATTTVAAAKCGARSDVDAIDDDAVFANVSGVNRLERSRAATCRTRSSRTRRRRRAARLLLRPPRAPAASRARAGETRRSNSPDPLSPPSRPPCGGLFSYEWKHLDSCARQAEFNRWLFGALVQPGRADLDVGTLASPSDPLFNLMHPLFDKVNARERAAHACSLCLLRSAPGSPLSL